jgi:hypothetical protein
MPGIVGIIGTTFLEEKQNSLHEMVKCMLHESFYNSGFTIEKRLDLCVGWVARSGSYADHMPVWNEASDICGREFC